MNPRYAQSLEEFDKDVNIFGPRHKLVIDGMRFENIDDNFISEWQYKAKRLQARRWRKLKHQLA